MIRLVAVTVAVAVTVTVTIAVAVAVAVAAASQEAYSCNCAQFQSKQLLNQSLRCWLLPLLVVVASCLPEFAL